MPKQHAKKDWLSHLGDEELLAARFCDLPISLRGTAVERRARAVFSELQRRGLRCRPAIWLAEEWFNPDGVVGFAIPFYLAHPRLARLERAQMLEAEGAAREECMRILRHETGHAVDEAYQLYKTPEYREIFGAPSRSYPRSYQVDARSRSHVTNLNAWYAQAHPVEDFAETFAVWLAEGEGEGWRRKYRSWPALGKLEAVSRWMEAWAGRRPLLGNRRIDDVLAANTRTLAQHYSEKRAFYGIDRTAEVDDHLLSIFHRRDRAANGRSAARLLRRIGPSVGREVAQAVGIPRYTADQVIRLLVSRARALDLKVHEDAERVREQVVRLTNETAHSVLTKGRRIPL